MSTPEFLHRLVSVSSVGSFGKKSILTIRSATSNPDAKEILVEEISPTVRNSSIHVFRRHTGNSKTATRRNKDKSPARLVSLDRHLSEGLARKSTDNAHSTHILGQVSLSNSCSADTLTEDGPAECPLDATPFPPADNVPSFKSDSNMHFYVLNSPARELTRISCNESGGACVGAMRQPAADSIFQRPPAAIVDLHYSKDIPTHSDPHKPLAWTETRRRSSQNACFGFMQLLKFRMNILTKYCRMVRIRSNVMIKSQSKFAPERADSLDSLKSAAARANEGSSPRWQATTRHSLSLPSSPYLTPTNSPPPWAFSMSDACPKQPVDHGPSAARSTFVAAEPSASPASSSSLSRSLLARSASHPENTCTRYSPVHTNKTQQPQHLHLHHHPHSYKVERNPSRKLTLRKSMSGEDQTYIVGVRELGTDSFTFANGVAPPMPILDLSSKINAYGSGAKKTLNRTSTHSSNPVDAEISHIEPVDDNFPIGCFQMTKWFQALKTRKRGGVGKENLSFGKREL